MQLRFHYRFPTVFGRANVRFGGSFVSDENEKYIFGRYLLSLQQDRRSMITDFYESQLIVVVRHE